MRVEQESTNPLPATAKVCAALYAAGRLHFERERQLACFVVPGAQHPALLYIFHPLLQDGMRLEKERQRAAGRVQQLQAHLAAMRIEQEAVKRRLGERLAAQEKAAADKAKERAALRRAGKAL